MNYEQELRSFVKRIRKALAWRSAAVGLFLGCLAALAGAAGDRLDYWWIEWPTLLIGPLAGALLGALIGYLRRPDVRKVAASVDRRAGLRDRLSTGMDEGLMASPFAEDVQEDAKLSLSRVDPRRLYPIGYLRWHSMSLAVGALTALVVILGSTQLLASPTARAEKEEMKKQAEEVERIVKPVLKESDLSKPSAEYAKDLHRFARELERSRMDRKEALKKSNELLDKGKYVRDQLRQNLNQNLDSAQRSLEAMMAKQLEQNGQKATPEEIRNQLEQMLNGSSPEYDRAIDEAADKRNELGAQRDDLNARMDDLRNQLKNGKLNAQDKKALKEALSDLEQQMREINDQLANLSKALEAMDQKLRDQIEKSLSGSDANDQEMNRLRKEIAELASKLKMPGLTEKQRKEMEARMKELEEAMRQLKFSKEFQEGLGQLMNDPKMKEILKRYGELLKKARIAESQESEDGDNPEPPKITKEQIAEMQKAIDEMAKKLADEDFRKQFLQALKDALDNMDELVLGQGMCMNFGMCMGLLPGLPTPMGNALHGGKFSGMEWVNKFDKGVKGEGKTLPTRVSGERHPTLGKETFIEVRGPARLGKPSQVPYLQVLPKYKEAAEEAMRKQKIRKDQEKRVRDYFRAIGGQG